MGWLKVTEQVMKKSFPHFLGAVIVVNLIVLFSGYFVAMVVAPADQFKAASFPLNSLVGYLIMACALAAGFVAYCVVRFLVDSVAEIHK